MQLYSYVAGFQAFIISVVAFAILIWFGVPVNFLYRKFLALAVTSILFSFVLAVFLYVKSFSVKQDELAKGGNSGEQSVYNN
jgi:Ergosterol biosynthesis ERG4/ERG24 family